jgi:hypothetical protein
LKPSPTCRGLPAVEGIHPLSRELRDGRDDEGGEAHGVIPTHVTLTRCSRRDGSHADRSGRRNKIIPPLARWTLAASRKTARLDSRDPGGLTQRPIFA